MSDTTLLSIGQQCSDPACHMIDFLPFKCNHCKLPYCGEHYLPAVHKCTHWDESKFNRVAPSCPLCNEVIAIAPGEDPNVRMDTHITRHCTATGGKAKPKDKPTCARGKCGKVLFAPIRCDKCNKDFCPQHRFPADHTCNSSAASSTTSIPTKSTAASAAASLAAINRQAASKVESMRKTLASTSLSGASSSSPTPKKVQPQSVTTSPAPAKSPHLFSKTDRRAKSERASRLRAMQARAKKGLLSPQETLMLAEEEEAAKADEGCVIS